MDTITIFKISVATVGMVQMLKNMITFKKGGKILWTFITILVGIGISAVQYLCPSVVMDSIIAISGATIFYDTIYQSFEKIFKKGDKSE